MKTTGTTGKRAVAILVDTSQTWGRGIISGVHAYSRRNPGWRIFIQSRGQNDPVKLPSHWRFDGMIARIGDKSIASYLRDLALPVVNVSALQISGASFCRVATDVEAAGRMAFEYFQRRGYRHFAYLSLLGLECVSRHHRAFASAIRAFGGSCAELGITVDLLAQSPARDRSYRRLCQWLLSLPKPVAVLTWSGGREVIDGCRDAGLLVPGDVALLSGSNDDLFCEVCDVPISAIKQPVEQIGMAAAGVLDEMMNGKRPTERSVLIAPVSVISRRSTDATAISDRSVSAALNFIQANADRPLPVTEVAAKVGVSRRVLERRFQEHLRRSPADCIRRSHLEQAQDLLSRTKRPLSEIAEACGFSSQQYLASLMRREIGMSPLHYRRLAQAGV